MLRCLILIGTRPEALKMGPLIRAMAKEPTSFEGMVVSSGQHRELLCPVLSFFGIRPDVEMKLMQPEQSPLSLTQAMLSAFPEVLSQIAPDICLVHGDTTTAYAGALCAFYAGVPVVHVEAGLRTDCLYAPYPEEYNRRAIDAMSDCLFAPTKEAAGRLLREGHDPGTVHLVGNTATDTVRWCLEAPKVAGPSRLQGKRLVLLTLHRREMSERARIGLLRGIRRAIEGRRDVMLLWPVHPSPAVGRTAHAVFDGCREAMLVPPMEAPAFQQLLAEATLLLTDSGGLQEEATYLGIPTLVLRDTTERREGIGEGILRLAGTDGEAVEGEIRRLLDNEEERAGMAHPSAVYGDGRVSERILTVLKRGNRQSDSGCRCGEPAADGMV